MTEYTTPLHTAFCRCGICPQDSTRRGTQKYGHWSSEARNQKSLHWRRSEAIYSTDSKSVQNEFREQRINSAFLLQASSSTNFVLTPYLDNANYNPIMKCDLPYWIACWSKTKILYCLQLLTRGLTIKFANSPQCA
jgi:hypothetical protein